ncbi:MAG: Fur family transcriptional regulator [Acidobacteriota bacterium]|nr:MAG: transcriptional repressor [Acidobacteriota bacterium]
MPPSHRVEDADGRRPAAPRLIERIRAAGIRVTGPRRAIARVLEEAGDHLDVEEITRRAQKIDPSIHRATVYRTLGLFKGLGLVDELDLLHLRGERHFYEIRESATHAHVICTHCGKILEIGGETIAAFEQAISEETGFRVESMRFEIGGYCPDCPAPPRRS